MGTVNKTWHFASDAEGLADAGVSAIAFAYLGTDGSPAAGCGQFTLGTKNVTLSENALNPSATETWADWGVPDGSVVTAVEITAYNRSTAGNGKLTSHGVAMRIVDDAGASVHSAGDLVSESALPTTVGGWAAGTCAGQRAVDAAKQARTTPVRLLVAYNAVTSGGGGSAAVDWRFDEIALTITYSAGPQTVSPSGIASTAAMGSPTASPGPVTISPTGIAPATGTGGPASAIAFSSLLLDTASAPVDYDADYTLMGWVKFGDVTTYQVPMVLRSATDTDNDCVSISGGYLALEVKVAGAYPTLTNGTGTTPISIGAWHHLAIVRNTSNGSITLYLDGAWEADGTPDLTGRSAGGLLRLGAWAGGGSVFTGSMNNVRVLDVALSQSAVQAEYASGVPVDTADAVATYPMDGATDLADATDGFDLTATSGTPTTDSDAPPWAAGGGMGTPTVSNVAGGQTVSPSGIASTAAFGTPIASPQPVTVAPSGIASTAAVGSATLAPQPVTIAPAGIASTTALGTPAVQVGAQSVAVSGIASTLAVGTPALAVGPVAITPSGIASTAALGAPLLAPQPVAVSPAGVASTAAVGTPSVANGPITLHPTGIAATASFGTAALAPQPVTVAPGGIASGLVFGTPVVANQGGPQTVSPTGIASTMAFGGATFTPGAVVLSPAGIAATSAVGTPVVTVGAPTISPAGIAPTSAFGTPALTPGPVTVAPAGIASGLAFGTPSVGVLQTITEAGGIASTVVFGTPDIIEAGRRVWPIGIVATVAFGTPALTVAAVTIAPVGIASTLACGTPRFPGVPVAGLTASLRLASASARFALDSPRGSRYLSTPASRLVLSPNEDGAL